MIHRHPRIKIVSIHDIRKDVFGIGEGDGTRYITTGSRLLTSMEMLSSWNRRMFSSISWRYSESLRYGLSYFLKNKFYTPGSNESRSGLLALINVIMKHIKELKEEVDKNPKLVNELQDLYDLLVRLGNRTIITPVSGHILHPDDVITCYLDSRVYLPNRPKEPIVVEDNRKLGSFKSGRSSVFTNGLLLRILLLIKDMVEIREHILKNYNSKNKFAPEVVQYSIKKKSLVDQENNRKEDRVIKHYKDKDIMDMIGNITQALSRGIPYPLPTMAVPNKGFRPISDLLKSIAATGEKLSFYKTDINGFFDNTRISRSSVEYSYYTGMGNIDNKLVALETKIMREIFVLISRAVDANYKPEMTISEMGVNQGMPGSPLVADLSMHHFDREVWKIVTRAFNGIYMRWVDDLIVLYPSRNSPDHVHEVIVNKMSKYASTYILKKQKTKRNSLMKEKVYWVGLGIKQNKDGTIVISQQHRRKKDKSVILMKSVNVLDDITEESNTIDEAITKVRKDNPVIIEIMFEYYVDKLTSFIDDIYKLRVLNGSTAKSEVYKSVVKRMGFDVEAHEDNNAYQGSLDQMYKSLIIDIKSILVALREDNKRRNVYNVNLIRKRAGSYNQIVTSDNIFMILFTMLNIIRYVSKSYEDRIYTMVDEMSNLGVANSSVIRDRRTARIAFLDVIAYIMSYVFDAEVTISTTDDNSKCYINVKERK